MGSLSSFRRKVGAFIGGFEGGLSSRRLKGFQPSRAHINVLIQQSGVDMTAGSLGQGLSATVGMALSAKITHSGYRVFCMVGDGELQEGQNWEAIMYAGNMELDNLVLLVDDNGMQIDDYTSAINSVRPLDTRLSAFGWDTTCIDGHDFAAMEAALNRIRTVRKRPSAIVLSTIKGKGAAAAEGKLGSHNMPFSSEDAAKACQALQ